MVSADVNSAMEEGGWHKNWNKPGLFKIVGGGDAKE